MVFYVKWFATLVVLYRFYFSVGLNVFPFIFSNLRRDIISPGVHGVFRQVGRYSRYVDYITADCTKNRAYINATTLFAQRVEPGTSGERAMRRDVLND